MQAKFKFQKLEVRNDFKDRNEHKSDIQTLTYLISLGKKHKEIAV
jgi:hypothetical protein